MALQRTGTWGFLVYLCCVALFGCSNGSGSVEEGPSGSESPPSAGGGTSDSDYTISVTISGLVGDGLVLQNNGANDIPVAANGRLTFSEPVANGAAYNVTILTQPTGPTQTCSVVGGAGTVANADVTNVSVTCSTPDAQSFLIRGTVNGLLGSGLVLQNNGGENLPIPADGEFSFATPLPTGSTYNVTVLTQPSNPAQTCSVNNNAGTVGTEDVTNVSITCSATSFAVQVSVSGLRGFGLQLQLNGGETLAVSGNGSYSFTQLVARGAPYSVRVIADPTNPKQTCVINNPSGIMGDANVTVAVSCTTDQSIGGTVKGLAGQGLVLQLNGGNNLPIASSGSFQFGTVLARGSQYSVTILTQPSNPTQECTLRNASGVVGSAPVSNIGVNCTTKKFKVNANVSGLQGRGLELRNDWSRGRDELAIAGNGIVTFPTALASGTRYTVSVHKDPKKPTQRCTIDAPTGTIGSADVTVNVTCPPPTEFAIGGTISGLQGEGLQLQNNGADTLALAAGSTGFEFPALIPVGGSYSVAVVAQPANPTQQCTASGNTGTVSTDDITSVSVTCQTSSFTVGGTVTGLSFFNIAVRLQLNGGEEVTVFAGQPTFTFTTPVLSGTSYNVAVTATSSTTPCTVTNGSGVVGGANITDVAVAC